MSITIIEAPDNAVCSRNPVYIQLETDSNISTPAQLAYTDLHFTGFPVEDDEFTVTFRDEAGNVLYSDKFKGANINKKFMLKSEEFGDTALNVVVKSKKYNTTDVYTINRSHTYVEETVVNKLK